MNLEDAKTELIQNRFQLVQIDPSWTIMASCHSLLDLRAGIGKNFFEFIQPQNNQIESIQAHRNAQERLFLPGLNFRIEGIENQLDFEFHFEESGSRNLLLSQKNTSLQGLNDHDQEARQELKRFSYIVSHDLLTPLRGISNLSEWIVEDIGEGNFQEVLPHLELLQSRVKRMEDMVHGIMNYSRAGQEATENQELNFTSMVRDEFGKLNPPTGFSLEIEDQLGPFLASRNHFSEIMACLLDNAIQHSHTNEGRIKVTGKELPNHYQISVQDNGPGISAEHHEGIFEIFHTLKSKDKVNTTGIGLTIVQKLVRKLGGEIKVISNLGEGAEFIFSLPKPSK